MNYIIILCKSFCVYINISYEKNKFYIPENGFYSNEILLDYFIKSKITNFF